MEGSRILEAIRSAIEGQDGSVTAEPWLAWLAICLCRHQVKQAWAFERKPVLYHQGLEAGWSYRFDTTAHVIVLEGPASVKIRMPLYGITPVDIDTALLADEVLDFRDLPFPEARLAYWIPERAFFPRAMAQLAKHGLLRAAGHGAYRPSPALEELTEPIVSIDFEQPEVQARWRKAFGDTRSRRGAAYQKWLQSLAPQSPSPALLRALCRALPASKSVRLAQQMLTEPLAQSTLVALEILLATPPDDYQRVEQFSHRLHPEQHPPELAWAVANLLMRRSEYRLRALSLAHQFAQAERALNSMGNTHDARWAFFMLEFDTPDLALAQVRRGLLSVIPECARHVAAVLALLDQPWCHRELWEALAMLPSGNGHQSLRYEIGASRQRVLVRALAKSKDLKVRAAAKLAQAAQLSGAPRKGPEKAFQTVQNASRRKLDALFTRALRDMAPTARRLRQGALRVQGFKDALSADTGPTAESSSSQCV
jgi:hypothetical protein